MKLYINDFNFKNTSFIFNSVKNIDYIYSDNCILKKIKDKYYKEQLINYDCFKMNYSEYIFYFDNNEYNYNELYNYIPMNHISVNETYHEMFVDYNIKLIKHCYLNSIHYYFEINELSNEILDNIITFLLKN